MEVIEAAVAEAMEPDAVVVIEVAEEEDFVGIEEVAEEAAVVVVPHKKCESGSKNFYFPSPVLCGLWPWRSACECCCC